ncbi:hypothetical protein [Natrarchaeobius chitinivorans]|uniref:Uncharacterized protein n=1 Tax=Natrarchaeobius chitinivorans TaxID=1679083 RepID=A0A3N6PDF1_NATCH|nr:hypothetical protein [Natrarchaeobius chitinivorans]RQG97679.1 hypothetical protein EA473_00180 [Natrarchaeobius chitinivorans]
MEKSYSIFGSQSDLAIERGETYDHTRYGQVEVTGIWKGVDRVDKAHNTNDNSTIIVRFATEEDGTRTTELTETVDEFIEAIE